MDIIYGSTWSSSPAFPDPNMANILLTDSDFNISQSIGENWVTVLLNSVLR
jgi:hypothetical protein